MSREYCATCKFYDDSFPTPPGVCRLGPDGLWKYSYNWCGQHEPEERKNKSGGIGFLKEGKENGK